MTAFLYSFIMRFISRFIITHFMALTFFLS